MDRTLLCIIAGYERGGTTVLSELLRAHPAIDAGFEGGFLLADSPREFVDVRPFSQMVLPGWGLSRYDLEWICDVDGFPELYERLHRRFLRPAQLIFDKTPAYMGQLASVRSKMPEAPAVVIVRDPRAVIHSWLKRGDYAVGQFDEAIHRYLAYATGASSGLDGALLLQFEELVMDPKPQIARLFSFLGLEPPAGEMQLDRTFHNIRGPDLDPRAVAEYRVSLDAPAQQAILSATREFDSWHWHGEAPDPDVSIDRQLRSAPQRWRERPQADDALRREIAGIGGGGQRRFVTAVASRLAQGTMVLSIGYPPVGGLRWLRSLADVSLRAVDWEGIRTGRFEQPAEPHQGSAEGLPALRARYDAVLAHSLLPFLEPGETRLLFSEVSAVLPPGGAFHLSVLPDAVNGLRGHGRSELTELGEAAGLRLLSLREFGHPQGQLLAEFRSDDSV